MKIFKFFILCLILSFFVVAPSFSKVVLISNTNNYIGLSTDTKPTLEESDSGSSFIESDTGAQYKWSDSSWNAYPNPTSEKNDYFVDISRGVIPGAGTEFKFGRSVAVTATESVIWDNGGNYTFLTAAETMDVISSSTDDDSGGIGARTLLVSGLDANYDELSELIVLDGTTTVVTDGEFIRVFRALVITSGTNDPINDANKGVITISGTTSSAVQAKIQINNGQTLMAIYTVPAGHTAYVTGISLSAGQGKQCLFKAKFRNGPTSGHAFSIKFTMDLYQTFFYGLLKTPLRVPEKTDIVITGQTTTGTIDASASFGIILIDD